MGLANLFVNQYLLNDDWSNEALHRVLFLISDLCLDVGASFDLIITDNRVSVELMDRHRPMIQQK